jgi:glycerate kinase
MVRASLQPEACADARQAIVLVAADAGEDGPGPGPVTAAVAEGVRATLPSAKVLQVPDLASGPGFVEQVVGLSGGRIERISLVGPHGELFLGKLGLMGPRNDMTAVIAAEEGVTRHYPASGLREPTSASSRPIGQLISAALDRGARHIIVGCGSSGAYDGGIGMAEALGLRFLDAERTEIVEAGGLLRLAMIDRSHRDPRLDKVSLRAVVDPDHALLGPGNIAATHAPRQGASSSQVLRLERGLARFAKVVVEQVGIDLTARPGTGAGGGLAGGLLAFAGASIVAWSDFLDEYPRLQHFLACADMAITAGASSASTVPCAHSESRRGHARGWLERKARRLDLPLIALSLETLLQEGEGIDVATLPTAIGSSAQRRPAGGNLARLQAASAEALRRTLGGWRRAAEST